MSRQSNLDSYFKCKSRSVCMTGKSSFSSATTPIMNDKNKKKRRNLSLVKSSTPEKASKPSILSVPTVQTEEEIVDLCTDDESNEDKNDLPQNSNLSQSSNSSQKTIAYNLTPTTPKKSPKASTSKNYHSPNSEKYFSPNKKRAVCKRTPVKRNLAMKDFGSSKLQCNSVIDEDFTKACNGMDDKSIFLLTIVYKCLTNNSLIALLDEKCKEILNHCFNIMKPGIRLVCRLFWRQRGWYRKEKLHHITNDKKGVIEDSQFTLMLNCLVENGLVEPSAKYGNNTMDFNELVEVLKKDEIKQICKHLKLKVQSKKDAENTLRCFSEQKSITNYFTKANSTNSQRVLDIMNLKVGTCYKLSDLARRALDKLYVLMYLGINYEAIRDKRLELMLIHDKINRETYPVDKEMKLDNASVVFRNKEEFERYWNAHAIYEDYLAKVDSSEKCSIVMKVYELYKQIVEEDMMGYKALPTWLRRYTPPYLYVKILEGGIQELKKDQCHHHLALDILSTLISQIGFRQHKKAMWYAEKALILHKLMGRHNEAAEVLIEGLKSPMSEEAKDAMRPRANKIGKQRNIQLAPDLKEALAEYGTKYLILEKTFHAEHIYKQHIETTNQKGKKTFKVYTDDGTKYLNAEDFCVFKYTMNGEFTHGEHWEGRIVTTIFYLLFWDIIYSMPRGVVGVFLSHYQLQPLDLHDESFYVNRKTLIDERLMKIESITTDDMVEMMRCTWHERPECELSGINRSVGWEKVRMVATCLGPRAAAALCGRLATNYGYAHSGFPDLTLWNVHTNKIKFVEVKTDTDKPSMKQLQWMRYLREHGIDTGFCYVGVTSDRSRARAAGVPAVTVKTVANINSNGRTIS